MPSPPAPVLDDARATFIQSGVAIDVAAHEAGTVPVLARGVACHLSPDRRRVTVFMSAKQNRRVLDAVAAGSAVAAVFCRVSTLETIQLKGADAAPAAIAEGDADIVSGALDAFVDDCVKAGFPADLARRELNVTLDDLAAVTFTVEAGFAQTPGPSAGVRL